MPETYEGVEVRRLPDGPEPEREPDARRPRPRTRKHKDASGKVPWHVRNYEPEDWPKETKGEGKRRRRRQRQQK